MDHDLAVGQGKALALRTCRQQEGAHGCRHADADGGHVAFDELHGVIDSHAGRDGAAGAVDIERDILVGILRLQEEHLCDHQ